MHRLDIGERPAPTPSRPSGAGASNGLVEAIAGPSRTALGASVGEIFSTEAGGFGRIDEVDERVNELLWRLDLREVAHTFDDHQAAPRYGLVCGVRVTYGDDVVRSPR